MVSVCTLTSREKRKAIWAECEGWVSTAARESTQEELQARIPKPLCEPHHTTDFSKKSRILRRIFCQIIRTGTIVYSHVVSIVSYEVAFEGESIAPCHCNNKYLTCLKTCYYSIRPTAMSVKMHCKWLRRVIQTHCTIQEHCAKARVQLIQPVDQSDWQLVWAASLTLSTVDPSPMASLQPAHPFSVSKYAAAQIGWLTANPLCHALHPRLLSLPFSAIFFSQSVMAFALALAASCSQGVTERTNIRDENQAHLTTAHIRQITYRALTIPPSDRAIQRRSLI